MLQDTVLIRHHLEYRAKVTHLTVVMDFHPRSGIQAWDVHPAMQLVLPLCHHGVLCWLHGRTARFSLLISTFAVGSLHVC